ncbi:MAG TPA: ATP-binding protein [Terriglobales bacterium]
MAVANRKLQVVTNAKASANRIFGTGEMADLTRAFDWSSTPLGPIENWPGALITTVNTMLATRHPMFLWWGPELIQFYNDGYRPSIGSDKHPKALGQPGRECWPEIWHVIGPQIEVVMTRGESTWHEDQLVPIYRDGVLEDVWWTYSYSPVRKADGTICGTLVTCSETTGRVIAERDLQCERARLVQLFAQAPAFVAVLKGPEHVFEMVNPLYMELVGDRPIIGRTVREAIPEAGEQGYFAVLDKVYQTGQPHIAHGSPIMLARHAGRPLEARFLDFIYQPIRNPNGTTSGIIVLGVDVTERSRAEQALMQAEKLSAVGRLAASIAHEINNPLEAITNLLFLAESAENDEQRRNFLRSAQQELDRVAKITVQTLRFNRESSRPTMLHIEDIAENVLALFGGRLRNSELVVDRQYRSRGKVVGLEGDLRQVLVNLISNALDASKQGGRIVIRIRNDRDPKTGISGVRVVVADTGVGIAREEIDRIFEPFYTTKEMTGTGLGLWVTKTILEKHDSKISVRSWTGEERHGSVFSVFLPEEWASR